MHVFLSPHLDDAVLSCGGLIALLREGNMPVRVITIMAGDPPDTLPNTPLVRDLHQRWAVGESPMQARRKEDINALHSLGVSDIIHLDVPDCPYRTNEAGVPLYPENDDLFGVVHPNDPVRRLDLPLPPLNEITRLYAPLGAGNHVDHRLVCDLAQKSKVALCFYEEYPYSASSDEATRITYGSQTQITGSYAVQQALDRIPENLQAELTFLPDRALAAKIKAIDYYESQISTFWDDKMMMKASVQAYAQEVAPPAAERLWARGDEYPQ